MPELRARLRGDSLGVEILSLSIDQERADCERVLAQRQVQWVTAWVPDAERLMKAWGFAGVPLTLLVDAEGTVVEIWDRRPSLKVMEQRARAVAGDR